MSWIDLNPPRRYGVPGVSFSVSETRAGSGAWRARVVLNRAFCKAHGLDAGARFGIKCSGGEFPPRLRITARKDGAFAPSAFRGALLFDLGMLPALKFAPQKKSSLPSRGTDQSQRLVDRGGAAERCFREPGHGAERS